MTATASTPGSQEGKVQMSVLPSVSQQQSMSAVQTALSRISEDSPHTAGRHRCLNISGIEKYPELQRALPRAWSAPALAPHVRDYLEAPLVRIHFIHMWKSLSRYLKFKNLKAETSSNLLRWSSPCGSKSTEMAWHWETARGSQYCFRCPIGRFRHLTVLRVYATIL